MATNNFKAFGIGAGANVTSQSEYESLGALLTGFQSGKASSAQINKVLRQASFVTSALAQFISDKLNQDVLDNGDLSGFNTKLAQAFASQLLSRSNPFADIKADGSVSTALANLGVSVQQTGSGPLVLQVGKFIIQAGIASGTTTSEGNLSASFAVAFPNAVMFLDITQANASYATDTTPYIFSPYPSPYPGPVSQLGASVRNTKTGAPLTNTYISSRFLAVGY